MRRIPPFVYGSVVGAFVTGIAIGSFLDMKAVLIFSSVLAGNSAIVSLICWWRPGLEAATWKLWLTATLANPLMLAAIAFTIDDYECLIGAKSGWACILRGVGLLVGAACLVPPITGLLARWWMSRRKARLSKSPGT